MEFDFKVSGYPDTFAISKMTDDELLRCADAFFVFSKGSGVGGLFAKRLLKETAKRYAQIRNLIWAEYTKQSQN